MTDESGLIKRVQSGEREAFRELVEMHKRSVYYLAYDLTGNQQDAEDLSQEVFIKAYRTIGKFRGESKIGSWLYRIAVNQWIDTTRRKEFRMRQSRVQFSEENAENVPRLRDDPERATDNFQLQAHIERALGNLSPRERAVFTLRHYHDMQLSEIGQDLNISTGTVKALLFRAVHKLQEKLAFYRKDLGLEEIK